MKRLGDDFYIRSQFKRPNNAPRTEGSVQSQAGRGDGTSQRLTTNDALTYLKEVKEMFHNQREKYDQFLEAMKDFKAQRTDTAGVIRKVKELFKGHNNLILGFNTFLPKGYEIKLEEKKTVEFEEAIGFVNKIKKRFQNDEHVYKSFLDILNMYRKEHKGITEVYQEVAALFDGHLDLLDEFTRFLPDTSAAPSTRQEPCSRNSFQRHEERSSGFPTLKKFHNDKQHRRDRMLASHANHDLNLDCPDLYADKASMKMQNEQRKQAKKEARERKHHDHDDKDFEHDTKPSRKASNPSFSNDVDKRTIKGVYNQEFKFCEKVKERVSDPDEYETFLKCLRMYSSEIVSKNELQNLMADVLGKYPDLVEGFYEFLEHCENIDLKLIKVSETDRYKEKDLAKSIHELDLSNCQRCTPSYRLLPEDYTIQRASQRSKLGAKVLNDRWVSVTSGSEDYSFKHMRRNQYEESLFKCEDDRFELDMLLESVSSASKHVEELLNKLSIGTINIEIPLRIEEHFSALNVRCIERLYGDHGLDVIDLLRKNPFMALPVILTRLKQKQEEWTRCRSDFNVVWADIYSKNHYKSLDHRSFYFKQQDSKNLSTKSLVAEIKEIKETKQKEHNIFLTVAAENTIPMTPNFEFEYTDPGIHENLNKLVSYSCEEVCSTKEQMNKVMRLWTTFLEPMLGIPPRIDEVECTEVTAANGTDVNLKASLASTEKANGSPKDDALPEILIPQGETSSKDSVQDCNDDNYSTAGQCETELRTSLLVDSIQKSKFFDGSLYIATESSSGKMCIDMVPLGKGSSGQFICGSKHSVGQQPNCSDIQIQGSSTQKSVKLDNGATMDGTKRNGYHGASAGSLMVEKEEGELSPIGGSEEDVPLSPAEDEDVKSPQHEVAEAICSQDAMEENDADADDEDSENASMTVEGSGGDSGEEECLNDEEDEADHEEIDGKVESEGEAEGLDDANIVNGTDKEEYSSVLWQ